MCLLIEPIFHFIPVFHYFSSPLEMEENFVTPSDLVTPTYAYLHVDDSLFGDYYPVIFYFKVLIPLKWMLTKGRQEMKQNYIPPEF